MTRKRYWAVMDTEQTTDLITLTMDQQAQYEQTVYVRPRFRKAHAIVIRTAITVMDIGDGKVSLALDREIKEEQAAPETSISAQPPKRQQP